MERSNNVYDRLAGVFSTDAMIGPNEGEGLLLQFLMHSFSPKEAEVALSLPFFYRPQPLETVARSTKKPIEEIKAILDGMVDKGLIRGKTGAYALLPILPGMFENVLMDGDETPWHREFARLANRLYETGYVRKYLEHPTRVLRSIPLQRELGPASALVDPDRVEQMIREHDTIAVLNNCQCRQARYLEGRECGRADRLDGCIAFGDFARLYLERGGARGVDRDSLRSIVRERIDNKLVFFAGNVSAGSSNQICTCCSCCCHMLGQIVNVDPGLIVTRPKYRALVYEEKCTGCGKCVSACNLLAHTMAGRRHSFEPLRCVGCGLCVAVCPAAAIEMKENIGYRKPSADFKRLAIKIAPAKIMAMIKSKLKGNVR